MLVINREKLLEYFTSEEMDPEQEFQVEYQAFAQAVLAGSPQDQWFAIVDHDCGSDVSFDIRNSPAYAKSELIPQSATDNGYWGIDLYSQQYITQRYYILYFAGGPQSAISLEITPVVMYE